MINNYLLCCHINFVGASFNDVTFFEKKYLFYQHNIFLKHIFKIPIYDGDYLFFPGVWLSTFVSKKFSSSTTYDMPCYSLSVVFTSLTYTSYSYEVFSPIYFKMSSWSLYFGYYHHNCHLLLFRYSFHLSTLYNYPVFLWNCLHSLFYCVMLVDEFHFFRVVHFITVCFASLSKIPRVLYLIIWGDTFLLSLSSV